VGGNPTIIDALMRALADQERDWFVRSAAARAVSQLPFDQATNVELINHEIGKLTLQLCEAYNADTGRKASKWRWAFATIYLAYRSETAEQQNQKHWGLQFQETQRGKAEVDALYKVLLPILKSMIETMDGREIPDAQIKALADWLAKNKPADRKVTPTSPDLKEAAASAEEPEPMTARNKPGAAVANDR
jgi:hypothetical protein